MKMPNQNALRRNDTLLPSASSHCQRRRQAATSLVEVLVVLVVILIGIFAVIRIFPVGFTQLQQSERRLRADRLARSLSDQIAADASNLPESISCSFYDSTTFERTTITDVDPDDLGRLPNAVNDPNYVANPYFEDVNKFRYIENEPVKIPLPTQGGTAFSVGAGAVYTLRFGPIYMDKNVGDPVNPTNPLTASEQLVYDSYLRVTGQPLTAFVAGAQGGSNTNLRDRGATSYYIDYDNNGAAFIRFPVATTERVYNVSFSYEDDSIDPANVGSEGPTPFTVPANTLTWFQIKDKPVVEGSEKVTRVFVRLAKTDSWDPTDPYQYKLISNNVSDYANFGVIAFNPAGANYSERTAYGQRAFTALVSYAVLDWHILRDDRQVPAPEGTNNIAAIRTTVPNIKPRDTEEPDGKTIYQGLYNLTDANASPDIQVFRLDDPTGTPLVQGDFDAKDFTNDDFWLNHGRGGSFQSGVVYLNATKIPQGTPVRILYKAQGDWAVAVQKAASSYEMSSGVRPAANDARSVARDVNNLVFHRTELNKSIVVTLEYTSGGEVRRLEPRQVNIDDVIDSDYVQVRIAGRSDNTFKEIDAAGVTAWRIIGDVKGVSLKTRVVYKDNQTLRNPWRIQDLETFVMQQPGN